MRTDEQRPQGAQAQTSECRADATASRLRGPLFLSTALAVSLAIAVPSSWAEDELEFSDFRVLIEINGTDGDAGFQAEIDGDGWKVVNLYDPSERLIYRVRGSRSVSDQGLTENFFESAEPSCDDVPLDVVLGRFPEGEYEIEGRTIEGENIESETILTHALPAIPVDLEASNTASIEVSWDWPGDNPALGECPDDLELAEIVVSEDDLFGFQVVVAREDPEPLLEFVAELGPGARAVDLPDGFIEPDAQYKWEVIAIGAGVDPETEEVDSDIRGNHVIAEDEFCTDALAAAVDCPDEPE